MVIRSCPVFGTKILFFASKLWSPGRSPAAAPLQTPAGSKVSCHRRTSSASALGNYSPKAEVVRKGPAPRICWSLAASKAARLPLVVFGSIIQVGSILRKVLTVTCLGGKPE